MYEYEGYDVYTVSYKEDGALKYGCACTSNVTDRFIAEKRPSINFLTHKFGHTRDKDNEEYLKFPSWSCYDMKEDFLTPKETCHVRYGENTDGGLQP